MVSFNSEGDKGTDRYFLRRERIISEMPDCQTMWKSKGVPKGSLTNTL